MKTGGLADGGSLPYGMVVDSKGTPWLTVEFGVNKIASIDPKTMAIKEYVCRTRRPGRAASRSRATT